MDLEKIKLLIDAMAKSGLGEMEFGENGWTLRLSRLAALPLAKTASAAKKPALVAENPPIAAANAPGNILPSPLFGTVYLRPAPDAPLFVTPGQSVKAGTTLCMIEAMKAFNEVRADRDGTVEAVLVASGQEVEAGQPLLRLR